MYEAGTLFEGKKCKKTGRENVGPFRKTHWFDRNILSARSTTHKFGSKKVHPINVTFSAKIHFLKSKVRFFPSIEPSNFLYRFLIFFSTQLSICNMKGRWKWCRTNPKCLILQLNFIACNRNVKSRKEIVTYTLEFSPIFGKSLYIYHLFDFIRLTQMEKS